MKQLCCQMWKFIIILLFLSPHPWGPGNCQVVFFLCCQLKYVSRRHRWGNVAVIHDLMSVGTSCLYLEYSSEINCTLNTSCVMLHCQEKYLIPFKGCHVGCISTAIFRFITRNLKIYRFFFYLYVHLVVLGYY